MTDPGFPRGGGANRKAGDANLLFCPNFPQNSMEMKKLEPVGGGASLASPLDPPMGSQGNVSANRSMT